MSSIKLCKCSRQATTRLSGLEDSTCMPVHHIAFEKIEVFKLPSPQPNQLYLPCRTSKEIKLNKIKSSYHACPQVINFLPIRLLNFEL